MGYGCYFVCSKCEEEYSVHLGIGMAFPRVYRSCVIDIESGNYGEEWKEFAQSHKLFAVDAEKHLYVCKSCGNWKNDLSLSLYTPKDSNKVLNEEYGNKTAKESGFIPYVMPFDLKKNYSLVKRYIHT